MWEKWRKRCVHPYIMQTGVQVGSNVSAQFMLFPVNETQAR